MVVAALLFMYFAMTLPIGLAAGFVGSRMPRAAWILAFIFVGLIVTAMTWALIAAPLANNRPEPNELVWLLIASPPFMALYDPEQAPWWLLIGAVNVSFFLALGAFCASLKRRILGLLIFALIVLLVVPTALFFSIPPCDTPGGCV